MYGVHHYIFCTQYMVRSNQNNTKKIWDSIISMKINRRKTRMNEKFKKVRV